MTCTINKVNQVCEIVNNEDIPVVSASRYKKDPLFTQEDILISCVASLKLLIVLAFQLN